MASRKEYVALRGSERTPLPGARAVGAANPDETIEVTLHLRARSSINRQGLEQLGAGLPRERRHLTREEFEKTHGADPEEIAKVEAFAHEHRLTVVQADPARRTVVLAGTIASFSDAFDVELKQFEHPEGSYRGRTGPVHVPPELAEIIEGVFGLDNRPQAKPHFRRRRLRPGVHPLAAGAAYSPLQIAELYDFPPGLDGTGQCIALIELGGGYRLSDLKAYFHQLQLPVPKISAVSVDGGHNHPTGNADGPDGEVMLDIEVAGALAPKAHTVVYFAPNTDRGFLDAITTAIHDRRRNPSVLSISWGGPESSWTPQALQAFDQAFQAAAALGVTVCCAAGDDGSSDGVQDGLNHVDFPASSPYALACGGTHLDVSGTTVTSETVWNDGPGMGATGGGVSDFFDLPAWQSAAKVPPSANPDHRAGRGVPDVAGDADPASGYIVRVDGQSDVIGGTSAVAPLWAGLISRINQYIGQAVGYLNPLLYGQLSNEGGFRDVTQGDNGAYKAGPGWDACTGLGSPDGARLMSLVAPKEVAKPAKQASSRGAAGS